MRPPTKTKPGSRQQEPHFGRRALRWALTIVGAVLVANALFGEKGLVAILRARQEHRALEISLARARAENARLREEARLLREDPRAIEEAARRDLGFVKRGEKLFIIRDVGPADTRPGP